MNDASSTSMHKLNIDGWSVVETVASKLLMPSKTQIVVVADTNSIRITVMPVLGEITEIEIHRDALESILGAT